MAWHAPHAAGILIMTSDRGHRMFTREVCPMQGTTTNGRYLLPFRTGAFLAGVPVQPVIIKYGQARISAHPESFPEPLVSMPACRELLSTSTRVSGGQHPQ